MTSHDEIRKAASISPVKASYWYPDGAPQFPANAIDSTLFTHLYCAFADLDTHTHKVVVSSAHQYYFSNFTKTVRAEGNDTVQTLLSIGGEKADKSAFATMASNSDYRKSFIDSSIALARDYGFHGLDLAWEYPSNSVQMTNFGILIDEWRTALEKESDEKELKRLLLTAAVYYSPEYDTAKYPIDEIKENLDWVNVISFDFYSPGSSSVTAPSAALNDFPLTEGPCADAGLKKWVHDGVPKEKLVMGFPYIGWAWSLEDVNQNGYEAPTTGPALSTDGSINYTDVKDFIVHDGAAVEHNREVDGDYCYAGTTWISYNDNQSIVKKVNYVKGAGLRGYYSWHVGADYKCGLSRAASRTWNLPNKVGTSA